MLIEACAKCGKGRRAMQRLRSGVSVCVDGCGPAAEPEETREGQGFDMFGLARSVLRLASEVARLQTRVDVLEMHLETERRKR